MRHAFVFLIGAASLAQTPPVENAKLETRALSESLGKALARIPGTAWAGYEMPAHGRSQFGCWNGDGVNISHKGTAYLEGDKTFRLLFRLVDGVVDKLRIVSPGCTLDAGGLAIVWFTGVKPEESVTYLAGLLGQARRHSEVLAALAQHEAPNAVPALLKAAKENSSGKIRGDALFWMSQRAGEQLSAAIKASVENDPETDVKRKAVFALSQLPKDEGVPLLIELAKSNKNSEVRKQAVFWLGQSNDPRAFQFIEQVLTH